MRPVYILGAGAHPWGKFPDKPQLQLALEAIGEALADARLAWSDMQGIVAASSRFEGGMGWGLHANEILQAGGESGIPAVNVGGGCAAGAIAIHEAYAMVASGQSDVVTAVGAERMPKGFIPRPPGLADDLSDTDFLRWVTMGATNPAYWALEARRRMHDFGTRAETFAAASSLMHQHAMGNPRARYRKACSIQEVLASPMVSDPLHLLEICAVSDGAAALVLGTEEQARRRGGPLVRVAGCAAATGQFGDPAARIPTVSQTWIPGTPHTSEVVGAVRRAMAQAGVSHADVDLIEMADNTAWHVLAWPELFGFAEPGESDRLIADGGYGIGGRLPI
ncbi:MAG: thiolase C-terminal domain-containing protein, partial [Steroidobacteraceae bacterium]